MCGAKGHIVWNCRKLEKHAEELKKLIKYTGDKKWFMDADNSKKSKDLFKAKGWLFKVSKRMLTTVAPPKRVSESGFKELLPFKLEDSWLDGLSRSHFPPYPSPLIPPSHRAYP